jgi:hypothetical protein
MSIVEPPTALDVSQQAREVPVEPVSPVLDTPVIEAFDHVRSHSVKCWWDYRDCRWQCSDG